MTQWCLTKLAHVHSYFEVRKVVCVIIERDLTGVSGLLTRQLFKRMFLVIKTKHLLPLVCPYRATFGSEKSVCCIINSIILIVYYILKLM